MRIKHKKLQEWVSAGLMSEDQSNAIHAYEENRKKGHFGRGIAGLSIFAILVGILSIIAANWHLIPGEIKIGTHILLNTLAAYVALYADKNNKSLIRECASLAFFGLTMTLIILVGQVYQLDGTAAGAFSLWLLITLSFMLLMARGYMTVIPWMIAFLTTVVLAMAEYLDRLPEDQRSLFILGIAAMLPLALMADGSLSLIKRHRPVLADVCVKTGLALSALATSLSLIAWHITDHLSPVIFLAPWIPATVLGLSLAGLAAHAVVYKFYKNDFAMRQGAFFAFVGLCALIFPFFSHGYGGPVAGAVLFISYWIFTGWIAQSLGRMRIVSFAIAMIAIRIFVIYVEIFGSLMDTGIGLIGGGVTMLALIYCARKMNTRLTKDMFHAKI